MPGPASILGQLTWLPANFSGVPFDYTKLWTFPIGLEEIDGYKEELGADGWEVQRCYQCPWSVAAAAMQWFYGFSFQTLQAVYNLKTIAPNGGSEGFSLSTGGVGPLTDTGSPIVPGGLGGLLGGGGGGGEGQLVVENLGPGDSVPEEGFIFTGSGQLVREEFYGRLVREPPDAGAISRVTPAQDPYRPWLYCDKVELIEGCGAIVQDPQLFLHDIFGDLITITGNPITQFGSSGPPPVPLLGSVFAEQFSPGVFADGKAKFRVTFRQRPYIVLNDAQCAAAGFGEVGRYVEREPDYAIQGLPLNSIKGTGLQLKFYEGPLIGQTLPEAGVMLMPTASWRYTWHDVPFYPTTAIAQCQGRINSVPFDGAQGWPLFDPGTLLCQAPKIRKRRNASGQMAFTVTWILDYRPMGWNMFPAGNGAFFGASWGGGPPLDDGANLVFQMTDFAQLFQVDAPATWN